MNHILGNASLALLSGEVPDGSKISSSAVCLCVRIFVAASVPTSHADLPQSWRHERLRAAEVAPRQRGPALAQRRRCAIIRRADRLPLLALPTMMGISTHPIPSGLQQP